MGDQSITLSLGPRHREFTGFLKRLDAAYPADTRIKLILDNHSAHISKETKAWIANQPGGRFSFVFTPKHGSWLNLIEGLFSKMARSMPRHIRVASKVELKERILAYLEHLNRDPIIHRWTYKIAEAAIGLPTNRQGKTWRAVTPPALGDFVVIQYGGSRRDLGVHSRPDQATRRARGCDVPYRNDLGRPPISLWEQRAMLARPRP